MKILERFDYQNGIVHIQIKADGRTIDVMRIHASKGKPYVIGSSYGGSKGNSTFDPRIAHSVDYLNGRGKELLMGSKLKDPATLEQFKKPLRLLWMSNGTFFRGVENGEGALLSAQGPVVMSNQPITDISRDLATAKRSRWYYGQMDQRPHYGQAVGGLESSQLLARYRYPSIIGGGAPLIKDGLAINRKVIFNGKRLWKENLGFDDQFDRDVGPIIASNKTGNVNYLIFGHDNFFPSWEHASLYLRDTSRFLSDIKHKGDGQIHNAVVYDGGGSPQLWIRGQGMVIDYDRPVPHRICLWGS